jgi:hypothetical protein
VWPVPSRPTTCEPSELAVRRSTTDECFTRAVTWRENEEKERLTHLFTADGGPTDDANGSA